MFFDSTIEVDDEGVPEAGGGGVFPAPLASDETVLEEGDIVKIDMGCHIDGFIAILAHTHALQSGPITGRVAYVIAAANTAAEVALRLVKPGKKNKDVTEAIQKVAAAYDCKIIEGVLSHQMKQFVIDANKVILSVSNPETRVDEAEFEENEVYAIDISLHPCSLDLIKQSLEKEKSNEDDNDSGEMETKPVVPGLEGDDRSVTYEELQQRLRRKIEQFQSGRSTGVTERQRRRNERKERYEASKGTDDRKRKRETVSDEKKPTSKDSVDKKVEEEVAEASKGLTFSRIKLSDEEVVKKKRRLSKAKELVRAKQLAAWIIGKASQNNPYDNIFNDLQTMVSCHSKE